MYSFYNSLITSLFKSFSREHWLVSWYAWKTYLTPWFFLLCHSSFVAWEVIWGYSDMQKFLYTSSHVV